MPFDAEPSVEVAARDRLIRLRDFLAGLKPEQFNMDIWRGYSASCGTVACIAGWTEHLFEFENESESTSVVGAFLGLDHDTAYDLFYPPLDGDTWSCITTTQAVAVLDHLLETGEVDWSVAFK